jgi:hypothetical protein
MALGCLVMYHLPVVKTSVPECWSTGSWVFIIGCYVVIGIVSLMYYLDLLLMIYRSV